MLKVTAAAKRNGSLFHIHPGDDPSATADFSATAFVNLQKQITSAAINRFLDSKYRLETS